MVEKFVKCCFSSIHRLSPCHRCSFCSANDGRYDSATMFFLRVHSVDSDHPLTPQSIFSAAQSNRDSNPSPKFSERRGVLHLFRSISHSSLPNPSSHSSLVFIVAVPNYLSYEDFIRFTESHIDHVSELLFIRYRLCSADYSLF